MKRTLIFLYFLVVVLPFSMGQSPTHYPKTGTEPVDLNPANIVLYIVIPVLMVVAFFWLRRRRKNQIDNEKEA